jgi:NAD(P)H dehydrogenase (quinone)
MKTPASSCVSRTSELQNRQSDAETQKNIVSKILVTGASGHLGKKTLQKLLKKKPASQLAGLVRDPAKAEDVAALGIELRQGDYLDLDSLSRAFRDVEKLMLISTQAFTDRKTAHANVIDAAVGAGMQHLVYMPIIRNANSSFVIKEVALATDQLLVAIALAPAVARP